MLIWQGDFYKRPISDEQGQIFWELLLSDQQGNIIHEAKCIQSQANVNWLLCELEKATKKVSPDQIRVFRPQSLGLLANAAQQLGITVVATRRTKALKEILKKRTLGITNNLTVLEQPPPQALPENIWGEQWRFVTFRAGDLKEFFQDLPIPILNMPDELLPINLGLPSTLLVPGMVIYGGRKSIYLARHLEEEQPVALNYISTKIGQSGGLILESGLVNRWVLATFENAEVAQAAARYEQRKKDSQGLHFLLVQPDETDVTYTGFWLLQEV